MIKNTVTTANFSLFNEDREFARMTAAYPDEIPYDAFDLSHFVTS